MRKGFTKGLLTVIGPSKAPKDHHGHRRWQVRCECGAIVDMWGYYLAKGVATGDPVQLREGATCGKRECQQALRDRQDIRALGGVGRQEAYAAETKRIRAELVRLGNNGR